MAWQDRDYYREDRYRVRTIGRLPMWSVTTWLIVINVAVFILDRILGDWYIAGGRRFMLLEYWGHFSALTLFSGQVWRLITFQFLHASLGHLFFNMLSLYFFGPFLESYLGSRRYLGFYLLCGMAGAVAYLLLWLAGLFFGEMSGPMAILTGSVPLVGASAGIFGILIAAARIAPDIQVMLLFPPIPMRLRTLAWIMVGIAAWTVLTQGSNYGGHVAHLVGAALGFVLIRYPHVLNIFNFSFRRPRMRYHDPRNGW